jgi:tyrosyl-tRNA synthetase
MKLSEELAYRGFVNQSTFKDLSALDNGSIKFYFGVDPSADSMTVGNLAAAMMVRHFIEYGHKAFLLVGGATGMIGDPDGKKQERTLLSEEDIAKNKSSIAEQYRTVFANQEFDIVDNFDWFKDINYLHFLRDVGKHVPMRQMLGRDFVQSRLGEEGSGISYAEFSYSLIQGYDFLHLYREHGVTLQVCGADQWGNSITGVDLIRRIEGVETHVYSTPLVVNKVTGVKFGKSEEGAVWLDAARTTPTQFYQFWINCDDAGVEDYLKIYTLLPKNEIDAAMQTHNANPKERFAQSLLAQNVTDLVHGTTATSEASFVTNFMVGKDNIGRDLSAEEIELLKRELRSSDVAVDSEIAEALVNTSLASSKTEARRFIKENAVSINGVKVQRENFSLSDFQNERLILRRGKTFKDSAIIELRG